MKLLSVNVGLPREIEWKGKLVRTSIFKSPRLGPVAVSRLNLSGDEQSDLSVHGGLDKAVYAYPAEHYAFWREKLPDLDLTWGAFGENLTIEGVLENTVHIGDTLRIGSAMFVVSQPRLPCFKLGLRLGRDAIVGRFLRSEKTGFYLAVIEEGEVRAGDRIESLATCSGNVTVTEVVSLYGRNASRRDLLRKTSDSESLPPSSRDHFRNRLQKSEHVGE